VIKCKICDLTVKTISSLSHHVRNKHSLDSKQYFNQYIKTGQDGLCKICNKETQWINLNKGYKPTCSHTCGGILHRQQLKQDNIKYATFTNKVTHNAKKIWHQRELNGQKQKIANKISNTLKRKASELTVEQRRDRYGWLNKYTGAERQEKIDKLLCTGMFEWWRKSTQQQRDHVYLMRRGEYKSWLLKNKTMLVTNNYTKTEIRKMFTKYLSEMATERQITADNYQLYRKEVDRLTSITYTKYKDIINPENLKRSTHYYHLDHKLSVYEGYLYNIPASIISSVWNLQMLPARDNCKKSLHSNITIHQLLDTIKKHDTTATI